MIDIKFIRDNPDKVQEGARAKGRHVDVEKILAVDKKHRELLQAVEHYRAEKNEKGKGVAKEKDAKKKKALLAVLKEVDVKEKELEPEVKKFEEQLHALLYEIPNLPAPDVRIGKDDTENEIVKRVGEPTQFSFTPKNYMELAALHDLIDVERAAKVSGTRFGYLKNEAALLEFALLQFGMETLTKEGFIPVIPPVVVKAKSMRAMGYLEHGGEEETYHFKEDDLYFVGTSEQSVGPMHGNEIFDEKDLPRRYVAFSTCFRREAGTYGKDTKGILRVHQFDKVEMLTLTKPEESDKEHEYLLSIEEKFMQALKLPYHVVKMCTGDLGDPAARKYDIEAWIPSENKYRETHSTSNCTDFQSRRLNIRYRSNVKGQMSKVHYVHMLNGTVFSMNRPIIAILENYQQKDGSILIPDVLQKYMGGKKKIG